MELDQYFLAQQLGAIEKDLVVLEIIDIFQLERRHACLPDNSSGGGAERYILRRNDRIGQIGRKMLLCQHLMREIEIILINKAPVEIFLFVVVIVVPLIRQYLVLQVLFHNTIGRV